MDFQSVYSVIDPFLIPMYRFTGDAFLDFLLGTWLLASITLLIGEFTLSVAYLANRKSIQQTTHSVMRYQNISVDAIEARDKASYKAANKMANDAFGKSFFQQIALSTGFLWPIPFALGWMHYRFADVNFRILFTEVTVGYPVAFFSLFALSYLGFKRIKYHLPYFRRIGRLLDAAQQRQANMRTWDDLFAGR